MTYGLDELLHILNSYALVEVVTGYSNVTANNQEASYNCVTRLGSLDISPQTYQNKVKDQNPFYKAPFSIDTGANYCDKCQDTNTGQNGISVIRDHLSNFQSRAGCRI